MNNVELKSILYVRLYKEGFKVKMNHRVPLNSRAVGFRSVTLDVVSLSPNGKIYCIFYIGRIKPRKDSKYRMLKKKIFYVEKEEDIEKVLDEFRKWIAPRLF